MCGLPPLSHTFEPGCDTNTLTPFAILGAILVVNSLKDGARGNFSYGKD